VWIVALVILFSTALSNHEVIRKGIKEVEMRDAVERNLRRWDVDDSFLHSLDLEDVTVKIYNHTYNVDEDGENQIEIGHDRLHRDLAKGDGLQELVLYDLSTRPEYEANVVAASILLSDEEVLSYIYEYGYGIEQIARALSTDVNLVALKAAALREAGHPFELPEHDTRFLK
jgi:hypothetical protein